MKKFVFISMAASLFAYNVTSKADTNTEGTLRYGLTRGRTPINFSHVRNQTITANTAYPTLSKNTTLSLDGNTIQSSNGGALLNVGTRKLSAFARDDNGYVSYFGGDISGSPGGEMLIEGSIFYGINGSISDPAPGNLSVPTLTIQGNQTVLTNSATITSSTINIISGELSNGPQNNEIVGVIGNSGDTSATTINIGPATPEYFISPQLTNGSLGKVYATINVYNGGILAGTSTINGSIINNSGGTVQVGQSVGTMTVTGNVTHKTGSIFQLTVDDTGGSSLHDVSGVFTIESGVTLNVDPEPGNYTQNFTYRVVEADGGIVGMFDAITEINPTNIETGAYHLEHYPTAVDLYFFATKATPTFLIANLSEQANNLQSTMLSYENDQRVMNWDLPCNTPPAKYQGYIVGNYANGHTSETSTMIPASYHIGGFQLGGTMMICDNFLGAGYFGYSHGYSKSYNKSVNTTSNNYTLGFLFELFYKWCTLDFSAMYTRAQFDSDRVGSNDGSVGGNLANGEIRALFNTQWKNFYFRPLLGVRYLGNWINSYNEDDGTPDRLHYSSDNWNELLALGGFLASYRFVTCKTVLTPHVKAEWIQRLLREKHSVTFQQAQGLYTTATAEIQNQDAGYLSVTGGLSGTLCSCITIDGTYGMNFFRKDAPTRNYRMDVRYQF